jgi:glycosyltransferase involved in cell wall biosynthesis
LIAGRDPTRETGGAESYMLGHARAARLVGLTPHVFALGPTTEVLDADWGVLHRVSTPMRPILATFAVLHHRRLVAAIARFLAGLNGPHVIHGHGAWSMVAVHASRRLAAIGVQAAPVATFFTTAEHGERAKFHGALGYANRRIALAQALELAWVKTVTAASERRGYHGCRLVAVNYESVRTLLEQAYGPRPGIHKLAYTAATAFRSENPERDRPHTATEADATPLIVTVSRHSARKGVDVLIRALAELRDTGLQFRACLIGDGTLLTAHRQLVRTLGLQAQVAVPGRVPDVMPYLRDCDVFVLPSTEEGSGSVAVLEALQAGAAIVSTDVDGIPEDLTHGVDALLVQPGSPTELRKALTQLLRDDALRRRLGAQARGLYERRFTPPVAARSLAGFYAVLGLRR